MNLWYMHTRRNVTRALKLIGKADEDVASIHEDVEPVRIVVVGLVGIQFNPSGRNLVRISVSYIVAHLHSLSTMPNRRICRRSDGFTHCSTLVNWSHRPEAVHI